MTENCCTCPRCLHPICPPPDAQPPYDELVQEVDNNFLSVKVPKKKARVQPDENYMRQNLDFDFNCADFEGDKCKPGCTRVHVIPDQQPAAKAPGEEVLQLRAIRRVLANDELKNTLEIEFNAPRNYDPLPELGPTPRIIKPKQRVRPKRNGNGKKKKGGRV